VQLRTAQIRPGVAGIQYPKLALLLRYLVFTHRLLKAQSEGSARQAETESSLEVQELLAKLLSEDRDPPPFPPEFDPILGQVRTFSPFIINHQYCRHGRASPDMITVAILHCPAKG